jgi:6-phosphofructokinase
MKAAFCATDLTRIIDEMDVGFKTLLTILGHIQRGDSRTAYDHLLVTRIGTKVVGLLLEKQTHVRVGLKEM